MSTEDLGDRAIALTAQLVGIDSVNPGLVPGAPGERAVAALLTERLVGSGFEVTRVESAGPARPSLVAVHRGSRPGRRVALTGHLDTVGVEGMSEPFTARVDGDRMLGRGASDMKAGVAGLVVAAEAAAAADVPGEVILALVADEEDASLGAEGVLEALGGGRLPDACLVGEPTWLDHTAAHRGFAVVEVVLTGRAAHSSQPAEGVNAVTHLGRLLHAVEQADTALASRPAHPLAGHGSLLVSLVSGGTSPFVLADGARAVVERRTLPGESAADALAEVEALVAQMRARDPAVDAACTIAVARDAWEQAETGPAAELRDHLAAALVSLGLEAPRSTGAPYWMESALWEAAGVPAVVCGPAGGGLHAADEWVDLSQVRAYPVAVLHALTRFCAGEPR